MEDNQSIFEKLTVDELEGTIRANRLLRLIVLLAPLITSAVTLIMYFLDLDLPPYFFWAMIAMIAVSTGLTIFCFIYFGKRIRLMEEELDRKKRG